jgi:hypothetical protein
MHERRGGFQASSFHIDRNFLSRFYVGVTIPDSRGQGSQSFLKRLCLLRTEINTLPAEIGIFWTWAITVVPGAWSIWRVRNSVSDLIYPVDGLLDQGR